MKEYVHGLFTTSRKLHIIVVVRSCILLSRSVKISCLQTELAAFARGAASGDIFARHLAAHQRIWN